MKNLFYQFLLLVVLSVSTSFLFAQSPFSTIDYVDINNINAAVLVHGDMWWDPTSQLAQCEFPKGSGKHVSFMSSLWMSGYDAGNNLHLAAQTYRQNGNDYWPGPLDSNGTLTYTNSQTWAKIWKVNQSDIDAFTAIGTHTIANTPLNILHWPAKGNPYAVGQFNISLNINEDMAPFVDVNSDGIYNPLQGDYPAIKGDQALWWVFSDNGPTHTETNATPLKVEIHAMAYAYSRGTLIDNVIYYEYNIFNRSSNNYNNFRIGLFSDADLGWAFDDYIGFDSTRRMGIEYNGKSPDGSGQVNSYGNMIPMMGVTMIELPGDNAPTSFMPVGAFDYYNNDATIIGNPVTPGDHDNYLRSMDRGGNHLKNDFQGYGIHSTGFGTGPNTNYVYTGDPSDTSKWSECAAENVPNDRRFIITSNDLTLASGSSQKIVMALVVSNPTLNNGCPNVSFDSIKVVADTAWHVYFNPPPVAVHNVTANALAIRLFPDPATDKLYIETGKNAGGHGKILVFNTIGQQINVPSSQYQDKIELDVNSLTPGVYYILYRDETEEKALSFVKQ